MRHEIIFLLWQLRLEVKMRNLIFGYGCHALLFCTF